MPSILTTSPVRTDAIRLDPDSMFDITDATESARTILLGLNTQWIKKQGDFFVESPINFVTAIIWFLRKYEDGVYCTLPHVIELMQVEYDTLFPVLNSEPEIEVFVNPFYHGIPKRCNGTIRRSGSFRQNRNGQTGVPPTLLGALR